VRLATVGRRLTAGAWVEIALDVLRRERKPELTLVVPREPGETARGRSRRAYARALAEIALPLERASWSDVAGLGEDAGPGLDGLGGEDAAAAGHGRVEPGSARGSG